MCVVINHFLSLSNLCDIPRFHCPTCSGLCMQLFSVTNHLSPETASNVANGAFSKAISNINTS